MPYPELFVAPMRRELTALGVRELGLPAPLVQAESAEDHDLVAALIRWRSSESGA